jgi:hypothetical protein
MGIKEVLKYVHRPAAANVRGHHKQIVLIIAGKTRSCRYLEKR